MGVDVGQFGLGEDLLCLEKAEKRHLSAGIEGLREGYRLPGLGKDEFLVPVDQPLRRAVGSHGLGCLRCQIKFHHPQVGAGGGDVGPRGADVALIAVEQRHRHHDLRHPHIHRRHSHLALVSPHQADVRDRIHDRALEGPLVASDDRLRHPRPSVEPHHGLLELLEVEVGKFLVQVGFQFPDVHPGEPDSRRQLPPSGLDEYRGIEDPDFSPVPLNAPEEDVGLRPFAGIGELSADLVRSLGNVEEEFVDLQPPLRDKQRIVRLPDVAEHVIAGTDQLVFRFLHIAQGCLLRQP